MSAKVKLKNLNEGYQSIITNGRHAILGDEPLESKGTDLGMAPGELLLAALSHCKAATIRYAARKQGWDIGEVRTELSYDVVRGEDRALHTHVKTHISIDGATPEQTAELLKQADRCYVQRMIEGNWSFDQAESL